IVPHPADVAIIGGGIVGLATALALGETYPRARLVILDREPGLGAHETGPNSGVIHSGVYYKPGSLKARLCVEGGRLMKEFCDAHGIGWERCGKVIVATDDRELPRLQSIYERGTANGLYGLKMISGAEVAEHEPHCRRARASRPRHRHRGLRARGPEDGGAGPGTRRRDHNERGSDGDPTRR